MILIPHTMAGRFRMSAVKADGRVRPLQGWSPNLILDSGMDLIAAGSAWLDYCHVGSSAVAEAANQTGLLAPVAVTGNRTSANSTASNAAPWKGVSSITYKFGLGQIVGAINEVAVGPGSVLGSATFNRALTKDSFGSQHAVQVLADEQLEVEYELSVFAPAGDVTGTVQIDGAPVAYTARAAFANTTAIWAPYRAGSFATAAQAVKAAFAGDTGAHIACTDGVLGADTVQPGGTYANAGLVTPQPYVAGSRRALARLDWDVSAANFGGGIRSLLWRFAAGTGAGGNSLGAYQLQFGAPVMKNSNHSFFMYVGISWGRA